MVCVDVLAHDVRLYIQKKTRILGTYFRLVCVNIELLELWKLLVRYIYVHTDEKSLVFCDWHCITNNRVKVYTEENETKYQTNQTVLFSGGKTFSRWLMADGWWLMAGNLLRIMVGFYQRKRAANQMKKRMNNFHIRIKRKTNLKV